jgi:hypothetical protein
MSPVGDEGGHLIPLIDDREGAAIAVPHESGGGRNRIVRSNRGRLPGHHITDFHWPPPSFRHPFVERLIGSIRRECLDHVVVLGERHLHRILSSYFVYYHRSRTHLSLVKDAPDPRSVTPPEAGQVIELPEVGGLHHRYERRAAGPPPQRDVPADSAIGLPPSLLESCPTCGMAGPR